MYSIFCAASTNGTRVNDTIIGDPLFTIPLRNIDEREFPEFESEEVSLCYEYHGERNRTYNLISDRCTTVSAQYSQSKVDQSLHVMSEIGIKTEDNSGNCQIIRVRMNDCKTFVNGLELTMRYQNNGVTVLVGVGRSRGYTRVVVPNCVAGNDLVMWITCNNPEEMPMLEFFLSRGASLDPGSHGLIGELAGAYIQNIVEHLN